MCAPIAAKRAHNPLHLQTCFWNCHAGTPVGIHAVSPAVLLEYKVLRAVALSFPVITSHDSLVPLELHTHFLRMVGGVLSGAR